MHIPSLTSECISNIACTSTVGACISNHRGVITVIIREGHNFKIYNFLKKKITGADADMLLR